MSRGLPSLVVDDDDGQEPTLCVDYATCFAALVRAIADDDADGVRRALAHGVGPSDLLGERATKKALRDSTPTPFYEPFAPMGGLPALAATPYIPGGGDDEEDEERDPDAPDRSTLAEASMAPRAQARLTRPDPTTPLGLAAAHGSVEAARALVEAGAVPWPTPEAVLNEALATMNVRAFLRPRDLPVPRGRRRRTIARLPRYDAADMVGLLLDAFGRSDVLSAWDVNPLSVVADLLSADARIAAATGVPLVGPRLSRMLLDAGYSPDERSRGVVLLKGLRGSPHLYQRARVREARLTAGRDVLERVQGIDDRYPSLADSDLVPGEAEEVPPYAPLYRDALWVLAQEYADVGPRTAADLHEFIEQGVVPFQ